MLMGLFNMIAFANPQAEGQAPQSPILALLPFILIIGVFYFLLIRPQRQQQKRHQELIESVGKNDEVITAGGIHGTIVNVKENTLVLRVADNVKIEVQKGSIMSVKKSHADLTPSQP